MTTALRVDKLERNAFHNAALDVWQRVAGGSTTVGACSLIADRWAVGKSGTMVATAIRSTDVPTIVQSGFAFNYSMLVTVTTAQASLGTTDYLGIRYGMEGYDFATLQGKTNVMLYFWFKTSRIGTYTVALRSGNNDSTSAFDFTIASANTWTKVIIPINFLGNGVGTWWYDTRLGLAVTITLAAGSTLRASALSTWYNANYYGSPNTANGADTLNATFQCTGFMLKEGTDSDAPFQRCGRTFQEELAIIQRYYEKTYALDTIPGTSVSNEPVWGVVSAVNHNNTNFWTCNHPRFAVQKRIAPTVSGWTFGTANQWSIGGTNRVTAFQSDTGGAYPYNNTGGSITPAAQACSGHYAAEADFTTF